MGMLGSLLGKVWSTETQSWTFGRIAPSRIDAPYSLPERPLDAGKEYVNLVLRAMRITHVRRGTSKYFGAIHSFITLDHPLVTDHAFHVLTAPAHLRDLDAANLDRVVQTESRVLGPTPYHGGDLRIEMALFSVKSADLSAPFVSLLDELSTAAGTAFLGPAAPFLPLLKSGVKQLIAAPGAATLEIGIDRAFTAPSTGCYVAARVATPTALEELSLGQDGRLLGSNGKEVTAYPYFVFTIESTRNRKDWANIPDVQLPYGDLLAAARKGDQREAGSLFEAMKRRLRLSFDLVPADAEEIITWVDGQLKRALPASLQAGTSRAEMAPLEALPLYTR